MLSARFVAATCLTGTMVLGAPSLLCQEYPNKPLRIFTTTAGSGGDFVTRQIAQAIAGPLGQPVVVENRPALVAPDVASKTPPDGYTLLIVGGSFLTTPLLQKEPFDAVRDFSPI